MPDYGLLTNILSTKTAFERLMGLLFVDLRTAWAYFLLDLLLGRVISQILNFCVQNCQTITNKLYKNQKFES